MLSSSQAIFWLYSNAEGVCIVYPFPQVIYKHDKGLDTIFTINQLVHIYKKYN